MGNRWILTIVIGLAVLALAVMWAVPRVRQELAPTPLAAWVAIEMEGSGVAVVGPVEAASGCAFNLHAVLEARSRKGATVYYTEAPRLQFAGREVPAEALRRWHGRQEVKVLWFTVEGISPHVSLEQASDLDRFHFEEFFRPEWPRNWSIPGALDPRNDDHLENRLGSGAQEFGTQRFQVWIELYTPENSLIPEKRFKSWGAEEVVERVGQFPTVVLSLPGALASPSRVFGLSQIEPPSEADPQVLASILDLTRRGLAFSSLTVVRQLMDSAGKTPETLSWRRVDLELGSAWGQEVNAGDLLRAGSRIVVLFQDQGRAGRLDAEDLCFDFVQGARIRPLGEVFTGEGDVEWTRLAD